MGAVKAKGAMAADNIADIAKLRGNWLLTTKTRTTKNRRSRERQPSRSRRLGVDVRPPASACRPFRRDFCRHCAGVRESVRSRRRRRPSRRSRPCLIAHSAATRSHAASRWTMTTRKARFTATSATPSTNRGFRASQNPSMCTPSGSTCVRTSTPMEEHVLVALGRRKRTTRRTTFKQRGAHVCGVACMVPAVARVTKVRRRRGIRPRASRAVLSELRRRRRPRCPRTSTRTSHSELMNHSTQLAAAPCPGAVAHSSELLFQRSGSPTRGGDRDRRWGTSFNQLELLVPSLW